MSPALKKTGQVLVSFGFDPRRLIAALSSVLPFLRGYLKARKSGREGWKVKFHPALGDRAVSAGSATGHYFHMDLWAARRVFEGKFRKVVDVGSRVDGYVAHVLAFRQIEIIDVRPLSSSVNGLTFTQADMMQPDDVPREYADCVSCLHALEHFGLGRYGDPIDLDGWKKGFACVAGLLETGGTLLLAVPVGQQRIEFDSHRVFHPDTILAESKTLGLEFLEFALIDDAGQFANSANTDNAANLDYGCGCFRFKKL